MDKNDDNAAHSDDRQAATRRRMLRALLAAPAVLAAPSALRQALAAQPPSPPPPPPFQPRDFSPGAPPVPYPDPDVVVVHPSFAALRVFNAPVQRIWTGGLWCEGPAWCGQGRYLVWSDIPNNRQLRWIEDEGRVSVFRQPSGNSNGNTFDFQGRQLSCEHLNRRVVRYEHDGSVTVIADSFEGKALNSPNDVVAHPDGSYWFTDPPYGGVLYEGAPDAPGGRSNREGRLQQRLGQPPEVGAKKQELPSHVYRVDPEGRLAVALDGGSLPGPPNGLAFSPDYQKLYVVCGSSLVVCDVARNGRVGNVQPLPRVVIDGVNCGMDGVRVDVHGNLWCSSNAGNALGYSGVSVLNPAGTLIGRIRLPEACANLTFGGPRRNRLFMTASQSIYAVYVNTQGAAPA
jgi:gluconolactonase